MSRRHEIITVTERENCIKRSANARGVSHDSVEHRLQVCRRAGDDTQNVARRRLLLECRPQLAVTRLQLGEQPHVLDGDHGLVGEGSQEFDVLVPELPGLRPVDHDRTDRGPAMEHRHAQQALKATLNGAGRPANTIFLVTQDVGYLSRGAREDRPTGDMASVGWHRVLRPKDGQLRLVEIVMSNQMNEPAIQAKHSTEPRLAQTYCALHHRIEHRLHIGRRTRYDPENLAGRRLTVERLLRFVEQAHVLNRDDRLVGEDLEQLHLSVSKRASLDSPDGDDAYGSACSDHWDAQLCSEIERSR